jgi:hypothetical protein
MKYAGIHRVNEVTASLRDDDRQCKEVQSA